MGIKERLQGQLNEEQYKAAIWTDTSSLILAWAGSGKTRTLTYKIAYLIRWLGFRTDQICAVTFTNKAANEMKTRLDGIADDIKKVWLSWPYQFDHILFPWIWTFHSLFLKFLKIEIEKANLWYNKNFGVYDDQESKSIVKKILKELKLEDQLEVDKVKSFISKQKSNGILPETYKSYSDQSNFNESYMVAVYKHYQKSLKSSNMLDFDDLLLIPYIIFRTDKETLRKRANKFSFVMVDEAQDTNWIQFELMSFLTKRDGGNITFIWDDFQSIYRWRWALMDNFLNLKDYRPDIKMFKLQINYRSRPHIIHASNHIIKNNQKQYQKEVVPHRDWNDKIAILNHTDEVDEARHVVELISKIKKDKDISWSDFAILYRKNALSNQFEQRLIMEQIPYKIYWWHKFLDRKEVKDILAYLRYINNPKDTVSMKRIINTPRRGISDDTIAKIEEYTSEHNLEIDEVMTNPIILKSLWIMPKAVESIRKFLQNINIIRNSLPLQSPKQVIEAVINAFAYKQYLADTEWVNADDKIANLWELINISLKYSL